MLSIGVRGGGQTYLPTAAVGASGEVKAGIGGTGTLDLRYTYYGSITDRVGIGLAIGAGIGYGSAVMQGTCADSYTNYDYPGNQLDYTVSSAFRQTDRFAKGEASLLAAFRFGNITMNIGPRVMMPFMSSSSLTITSANIDAYYPAYDVHVVNQSITGKLETPYSQAVPSSLPAYNVLMALETGYEWHLNDKNSLGVQAFADIAVWSAKSPNPLTPNPLIQVHPITDAANPVPTITVNAPTSISGRRYLAFGIRAYYAFGFSSSRSSRRYPPRDTRTHHNRYWPY